MDELIRRQDALNIASGLNIKSESFAQYNQGVNNYCAEIANLPTIEPRKGKWLPDNNSVYEMRFVCSECNESQVVPTTGFTKYKPIWNFCPNCGADMREEDDNEP